jgi:hypothetical protein
MKYSFHIGSINEVHIEQELTSEDRTVLVGTVEQLCALAVGFLGSRPSNSDFEDEDDEDEDEVASPALPFPRVVRDDLPEPEPEPEPDPPVHPMAERAGKLFQKIIQTWTINFDQEGTEQPDRVKALMDAHVDPASGQILAHIVKAGGLTQATHKVLWELWQADLLSPDGAPSFPGDGSESYRDWLVQEESRINKMARQIAENVTQVGSIAFPPLSDLLEYHNPYAELSHV